MVISYIEDKLKTEEIAQLLNDGWRLLMMDRNFEQVIRVAETILQRDPKNAEAQSLLASALKEKKK
jgi:Flp pilus assembly protein TadD